jgi:uncharacterized RDD family membrane protein YckC
MPTLRRFDPHPPHRAESLRGRPLASFGRRGAALALDFIIAGVAFLTMVTIVIVLLKAFDLYHPPDGTTIRFKFFSNWYSIAWLVGFLGLSNHHWNGQTLGKRLMRIRAVSLVHDRLRGWPAFERALAYGASVLEFGFGFVQYFLNPNRQTVHDRIAETIVVDERAAGAADVPR